MELTAELKALFIETAQMLKGHERRIYMALGRPSLRSRRSASSGKGVGMEPRHNSERKSRVEQWSSLCRWLQCKRTEEDRREITSFVRRSQSDCGFSESN